MSKQDKKEFTAYLQQCTDRQVLGVHEKESASNRKDYAELAETEARVRGLM